MYRNLFDSNKQVLYGETAYFKIKEDFMLITKAIFGRKLSGFDTRNCVIEGIELLNGNELKNSAAIY